MCKKEVIIYIYGEVQVTLGVILSNITLSNNLLYNLYFKNFTIKLHFLYENKNICIHVWVG